MQQLAFQKESLEWCLKRIVDAFASVAENHRKLEEWKAAANKEKRSESFFCKEERLRRMKEASVVLWSG